MGIKISTANNILLRMLHPSTPDGEVLACKHQLSKLNTKPNFNKNNDTSYLEMQKKNAEIIKLKRDNETLEQTMILNTVLCEEYVEKIEMLEDSIDRLNNVIEILRNKSEDLENQNDELKSRNKELKNLVSSYRKQVYTLLENSKENFEHEIRILKEENEDLENRNEFLSNELYSAKRNNTSLAIVIGFAFVIGTVLGLII